MNQQRCLTHQSPALGIPQRFPLICARNVRLNRDHQQCHHSQQRQPGRKIHRHYNQSIGLFKPSPVSDYQNVLTWQKNSHVCSACSHGISWKLGCLCFQKASFACFYTLCTNVYHMWTIFTFWQIGISFLFKETQSAIIYIINLPYSVIAPLETCISE